jgi:uncharacterized membrane protein YgcG
MGLFVPFALALAVFWLIIGIMLAKFLAQKYKGKPWNSRNIDSQFIYGSSLSNDRSGQMYGGGYGNGGRIGGGGGGMDGGYGRENIGMGQFGQGRFKGM